MTARRPPAKPSSPAPGDEILAALARAGFVEAEVYSKRGKSRRYERSPRGESAIASTEEGWAVRAGDGRRSFFASGRGVPPRDGPWPEATLGALRLPEPVPAPEVSEDPSLDAPLATEAEAVALFTGIARELEREAPGTTLTDARLEEGTSEATLISHRGVAARARHRLASLRLEARTGTRRIAFETAEREAQRLRPLAIARRIADRVHALAPGALTASSAAIGSTTPAANSPREGEVLLAPTVGARILEALAPFFQGPETTDRLSRWFAGQERIASAAVTIVDDGRYTEGLLSAAHDGEGVPTRCVELVRDGVFVQPLLAWWEGRSELTSGCARRASFRDVPRRGATHFFLRERAEVAVADLVAELGSGCYLIDVEGGVRLDARTGRFRVPVSGFVLGERRAPTPLGPARLEGEIPAFLRGIRGVARDLQFVVGDGCFGAPTLRVAGLFVVPDAGA